MQAMQRNAASSTSMASMLQLQPSMFTTRLRSAPHPGSTAIQPMLVVAYRGSPPPDRSSGKGSKQQQHRPQQQPHSPRSAAPPRAYQAPSSRSSNSRSRSEMLEAAKDAADKFVCRHDPFTVGFGCLLVTGYCVVAHGQDVGEALQLACFSTILGMVMQEFLVNSR